MSAVISKRRLCSKRNSLDPTPSTLRDISP
jgi:hypothetical protein